MGTTSTTVDLMWSPSEDNVGVDHYIVYRESAGVMNKIEQRLIHPLWIKI